MKSRIFNLDWETFEYQNPTMRKQLAGALQYFLALPDRFIPKSLAPIQAFVNANTEIRKAAAQAQALQMFTTTADFPTSVLPIIEKYHILPSFDLGYEQIFDVRDFSGSKRDGFTVYNVQSGLTFKKIKVGEKLDVHQMSGDKDSCFFDFYGGALGWHRQLFDDGDWWTVEDNAIQFRNKAYQFRASVFYALIEAVRNYKSACITLQDPLCTGCDALARADAAALNLAAQTILLNCLNKGYGIGPQNSNFVILVPIQMRARIRQALAVALQQFSGSEKMIDYNFQVISTLMLQDPNVVYVILPKYQLKGGYRMDLTLFQDFDILSYTDTQAGWMRYGACVGDIDQIECVDMTIPSGVDGR
jgi:hypothetical protein